MIKDVLLIIFLSALYLGLNAQNFNEVAKIIASDRGMEDRFGLAVSISGNYAIVGAYEEDEDALGGNLLSNAGAAYIFERDALGNWVEQQKIVASDRGVGDYFGQAVSISGNYAIIGAAREDEDALGGNVLSGAGAAYIFERDALGNWVEVQKIVASNRAINDAFGNAVAISGNKAIVGAIEEDEDANGANTLFSAGAAFIFERDTLGNWVEVQKIVALDREDTDRFGSSVAISGDYAIVGAYWEGIGTTLDRAGAAYIFERDSLGHWSGQQKIVALNRGAQDYFGTSVAISGNYAVVGADAEDTDPSNGNVLLNSGSAYVFERDAVGFWTHQQKIVASDRGAQDYYGASVAMSGNTIIVGARGEDEDTTGGNTIVSTGSAYIYKQNTSGNWIQERKIVASDRGANDLFGCAVAISGEYAIIGAYQDAEDASGGNALFLAGSAYIFERTKQVTSLSIPEQPDLVTTFFPNPVQENLSIEANFDINNLMITNTLGQVVLMKDKINRSRITINIEALKAGLYQLTLLSPNGRITKNFIVLD